MLTVSFLTNEKQIGIDIWLLKFPFRLKVLELLKIAHLTSETKLKIRIPYVASRTIMTLK